MVQAVLTVSVLYRLQISFIYFLGDNTSTKKSILKIFFKPGLCAPCYIMTSTFACDLSPTPSEAY